MTSSFLENVKIYLFSQTVSRYDMIYFGFDFDFRVNYLLKKSDIKTLVLLFLFHGLSIDILEKGKKSGVTRRIIFQEGQSYPHPHKFRG